MSGTLSKSQRKLLRECVSDAPFGVWVGLPWGLPDFFPARALVRKGLAYRKGIWLFATPAGRAALAETSHD